MSPRKPEAGSTQAAQSEQEVERTTNSESIAYKVLYRCAANGEVTFA